MNTDRLRRFLGPDYEHVMRYTITDAFADSFRAMPPLADVHLLSCCRGRRFTACILISAKLPPSSPKNFRLPME